MKVCILLKNHLYMELNFLEICLISDIFIFIFDRPPLSSMSIFKTTALLRYKSYTMQFTHLKDTM